MFRPTRRRKGKASRQSTRSSRRTDAGILALDCESAWSQNLDRGLTKTPVCLLYPFAATRIQWNLGITVRRQKGSTGRADLQRNECERRNTPIRVVQRTTPGSVASAALTTLHVVKFFAPSERFYCARHRNSSIVETFV
jgi:hypothetical protein